MTTNITWNKDPNSESKKPVQYSTQPKTELSYRGFTAPRDSEYMNLWGPAVDSNGNTVDGLAGKWNKDTVLYRAVDMYLEDQARAERARLDAMARAEAIKQMEAEAALIEEDRPQPKPLPEKKKIQVTSRANVGEAFEEARKDNELNATARRKRK